MCLARVLSLQRPHSPVSAQHRPSPDQLCERRPDNVPVVFAPLRRKVRALATGRGHVAASTPVAGRKPKRKRAGP